MHFLQPHARAVLSRTQLSLCYGKQKQGQSVSKPWIYDWFKEVKEEGCTLPILPPPGQIEVTRLGKWLLLGQI